MTAVDVLGLSIWIGAVVGVIGGLAAIVWGLYHLLACTDDDLNSLGYDDGSYGGAAIPTAALLTAAVIIAAT